MDRRAPRRKDKTSSRATLALDVPSDTTFLGLIRDVAKKMAEIAGFDEVTSGRLALAVDEATTNVMEHAYRGARDQCVRLLFEDAADELAIDILDRGRTVDPGSVPQVDIARFASEGRTGGLGVHLMGKIMDEVTFRRLSGTNVCHLVKRKGGGG